MTSAAAAIPGAVGVLPSPGAALPPPADTSPRERLLMDFGWRFHLGHASDPAQDFGFDDDGMFSKTGDLVESLQGKFDESKWRAVDLPHDWAVELDFQNDPGLVNHGFKPLDRNYPATASSATAR